jgi:hypothetical protein
MTDTVTFVTAMFDIYNGNDLQVDSRKLKEKRIARFEEIASTGVNIVVFCCPIYKILIDPLLIKYTNIKLLGIMQLSELIAYKMAADYESDFNKTLSLPHNRSEYKDTREYMIVINSKPEFIMNAIKSNVWNTDFFCWIDFSILYPFNDQDKQICQNIITKIGTSSYGTAKCILLPSIENKNTYTDYFNNVVWRFLAGFILGDKNSLLEFCYNHYKMFPLFLQLTNKLVWEGNYWLWLEKINMFKPITYNASFSTAIFTNLPIKF